MQLILVGKGEIYKKILPKNPIGEYWITNNSEEIEKKIINIEGTNGKWLIRSDKHKQLLNTKNIKFIDKRIKLLNNEKAMLDEVEIEEYGVYSVTVGPTKTLYLLFCMPVCDNSFLSLDIKNKEEYTIGFDQKNDIVFSRSFVAPNHAKISFNNGFWIVENLDPKFGTFVNNIPVTDKPKMLFNGDVVFIMGLKIIIMGNRILINNPDDCVSYDEQIFSESKEEIIENKKLPPEDEDIELYTDDDYYSRAPRITKRIETETIKIDSPPAKQNNEQMPAILVLGSTLSMGAVMIISALQSISGLANGNGARKETIISLFVTLLMIVTMLLFPVLQLKYEKHTKKKYEQKRQKKYKKYIESKVKEIDDIMVKQRNILFNNYISTEECTRIVLSKNSRLWERKIEDKDFLKIRLGIGDVPLDIDIQYPEKQFEMEEDNLVEILDMVGKKSKILKKAPITVSLVEQNVSAIISKNEDIIYKYIQNIILQLVTFHSYNELKLVFFTKKDINKKWESIKMLPHIWNNTKDIRFFTDDYEEMKEISKYLVEVIQERKKYDNVDYKLFMPYYLIITDDYKSVEKLKIITEILKCKTNIGFSILCLSDNLMKLPNECKTFIELEEGNGTIYQSEMSSLDQKQTEFSYEQSQILFLEKISKVLANIPIKYVTDSVMSLPNTYTFLEMYDVGNIEQLNILERWQKNDSTLSLRAPIGVDGSGMKIALDIHEKSHGPHGLIAGSTGSGKSELIITYILSLAINYHPDDVAFILIDYKGGGLAGAFKKREAKLPHLVGTITNIDTNGLQRSLDSIQSELRRRQIMFNEARNLTDEGTIDIYKYQKLYHEGIVKEPIPHLLIICDEFAELKQQQEDFMDELISVARIGRSLGVHLILATQKPAGIVNDQIRSNSKFGICLKVQENEDSIDVIKRPDAAKLRNAGQFYMQVGNDEYFVLGQSAWSGAPYYPSNVIKNKVDTSIEFISNTGIIIKKVDDTIKKTENDCGEQLTNIVRYLSNLAKEEKISSKQLWLDSIPENIYIDELKSKYNVKYKPDKISPVIGEYDDPSNQLQGIVRLNFLEDGNAIIYGSADSGKETLISTLCYDCMTSYSPEDVQMYLLDFGSESLKIYKNSPHVGDVVFINDEEKINRFFEMITDELKNRKNILSDFNGDYKLYIKTSEEKMPMIVVVINSYEAFSEMYNDKYEDSILSLTREGIKVGITFVFSVSNYNDIRYRLTQNFKQKIALQLNNSDDYFNILDGVRKKRPSNMFGRGLIPINQEILEFQTAKICEAENWNTFIREKIVELNEKYKVVAKPIPTMPNKVTYNDVKDSFDGLKSVPLGIIKDNLKVCSYNLLKNFVTIIASKNIEDAVNYVVQLTEVIKKRKEAKIIILDAERIIQTQANSLEEKYQEFLDCALSGMDSDKNIICVIIGVDKFINNLEQGQDDLLNILKKTNELGNFSHIIVENVTRFKNHDYDEWYKTFVTGDSGIWVGNGLDDQYLINITANRRNIVNNCGPSFGYLISQGDFKMIKLIGIKENEETE